MLVIVVSGCRPGATSPPDPAGYPPDFALVFLVRGTPEADAGRDPEPRHRSAQHVLTPDRLLRVALGPGVHADLYPPPTAKIPVERMALLYRLVDAARQSVVAVPASEGQTTPATAAPPTAEPAPVAPTAAVTYHLVLTAHGRHSTFDTDPRQNAAATALLDELIQLRGGR